MAIAIVNTPAPLNTGTGGPTQTLAFQCNSGTDFLTVGITSYASTVAGSGGSFITGVTYNGVALTFQTFGRALSPNANAEDTHIYTLVAPTIGSSQNLVVSYSPNCPYGSVIQPVCWSGVNPSSPVGSTGSSYDPSGVSPISDAITVASGNYALDQWGSSAALTFGAGQNSAYNAAWGSSFAGASYKQDATAMSATFTGSARVAHSWIEIKAAGAGTTPKTFTGVDSLAGGELL